MPPVSPPLPSDEARGLLDDLPDGVEVSALGANATRVDGAEVRPGVPALLRPGGTLPPVGIFGQAGQSCDCDPVLLGSVQLPVTELSINGGLDVDATLELTVTIL